MAEQHRSDAATRRPPARGRGGIECLNRRAGQVVGGLFQALVGQEAEGGRVALQRGVQAKRNVGIASGRNIEYAEGYQSIFPRVTENLA